MNERHGLTPGHWIAIATIAVGVLGSVIGVALSEHNARLANVETAMNALAETQARMEGEAKATQERLAGFEERVEYRLDRIESSLERLIQLHLETGAGTAPANADLTREPRVRSGP